MEEIKLVEKAIFEIDKLVIEGCYDTRSKDLIITEWEQIRNRITPHSKQEKGVFGKIFKI